MKPPERVKDAIMAKMTRGKTSATKAALRHLLECINNEGYAASLEKRKIYIALADPAAGKDGLVRIIDESGDDYLYPKSFFRAVTLPQSVKKAVNRVWIASSLRSSQ